MRKPEDFIVKPNLSVLQLLDIRQKIADRKQKVIYRKCCYCDKRLPIDEAITLGVNRHSALGNTGVLGHVMYAHRMCHATERLKNENRPT